MSDSNAAGGTPATPNQLQGGMPGGDDGGTPLTFDGWIGQQDDAVQSLVNSHVSGLRSALQSERQQRTELAKALKDATKDLEEGSKARDALTGLSSQLEAHEQQLAFYEVATTAGVNNLKLAWIAAREAGAIDQRGNVNIETLKAEYPQLFTNSTPRPASNAGSGAGGNGNLPGATDIDTLIRQRAGVI